MEILNTLGIDFSFLLVTLIGFVILIFILGKYAFGPIYKVLETRQSTIQNNLDEADERRQEMLRLQREYEERLGQIEEEARNKVQAAVRDAQLARDEIVKKAQDESAAIVARAADEAQRERQKAMIEARDQIAELAVSATRQLLGSNLNGVTHSQLIDEAIVHIGAANGHIAQPVSAQTTDAASSAVMTDEMEPPAPLEEGTEL